MKSRLPCQVRLGPEQPVKHWIVALTWLSSSQLRPFPALVHLIPQCWLTRVPSATPTYHQPLYLCLSLKKYQNPMPYCQWPTSLGVTGSWNGPRGISKKVHLWDLSLVNPASLLLALRCTCVLPFLGQETYRGAICKKKKGGGECVLM